MGAGKSVLGSGKSDGCLISSMSNLWLESGTSISTFCELFTEYKSKQISYFILFYSTVCDINLVLILNSVAIQFSGVMVSNKFRTLRRRTVLFRSLFSSILKEHFHLSNENSIKRVLLMLCAT